MRKSLALQTIEALLKAIFLIILGSFMFGLLGIILKLILEVIALPSTLQIHLTAYQIMISACVPALEIVPFALASIYIKNKYDTDNRTLRIIQEMFIFGSWLIALYIFR